MTVAFNPNWPEELKEASWEWQKQLYFIKGYEAKLERVDPEGAEFMETLAKLEKAREDMQIASQKFTWLNYEYSRESLGAYKKERGNSND